MTEIDSVKTQVQSMITCLNDIQNNMGLNDKGFYILLSYQSGMGIKDCKKLVESIFELEGEFLPTSSGGT